MDIARDIMISLEDGLYVDISSDRIPTSNDFVIKEICDHFNGKYLTEDVGYATMKLYEARFIHTSIKGEITYITYMRATDITYKGYEFLESIRDESVYNKARESMIKLGTSSLEILKDIGFALPKAKAAEITGILL